MYIELNEESNFSSKTDIKVKELNPNEIIIAKIKTRVSNVEFSSAVKYKADENGEVIFNKASAFDGVYEGVIEEGLFMNLSSIQGQVFNFNDPQEPFEFTLIVETQNHFENRASSDNSLKSQLNQSEQILEDDDEYKKVKFTKSFSYGLDYERIDYNKAHLNIYTKDKNNPVVLVISHAQRKVQLDKAAFLANNGFTAITVETFGAEYLSQNAQLIPVEIFEDIDKALEGKYNTSSYDILGYGEGGGLAVLMANKYKDKINKLVIFSPNYYVFQGISKTPVSLYTIDNKEYPYIQYKLSFKDQISAVKNLIQRNPIPLIDTYRRCIERTKNKESAILPYKNLTNDILLIGGKDDMLNDSKRWIEQIKKDIGEDKVESMLFENVGNFIAAPYFIAHPRKSVNTIIGGDRVENSKISVKAFEKVLDFLKR